MKIEKLAAIGELVSSVAIVSTLIYLAVQTQQTNSALIGNSRQATLMADMSLISMLVSNPEANENARRPIDELSVAEQDQVATAFAGILRSREFAWNQFQLGILDEPTLNSYMETIVRMIGDYPGYRAYWDLFSQRTNPEFTDYVNSILELEQSR